MEKPNTLPLNMECIEVEVVETMPNGWERMMFTCPSCGEPKAHVVDFNTDTGEMIPVTKQCRQCKLKLEVAADEV